LGTTGRRLDLITDKPNAPGGAWLEEYGLYHHAGNSIDGASTSGGGFGIAGGFDLIASRDRVLGAFFSLESTKLDEDNRPSAPLTASQTILGGYAGWRFGQLAINGSAGYGFVNFDDKRDISVSGLVDNVQAKWDGSSLSGEVRAVYTLPIGFL